MAILFPNWLSVADDKTLIAIHAQPGAKRDAIVGEFNGRLKVALNAPPVDGKANAKLMKYLSKLLGVSKSSIQLISGETSRDKRLAITSLSSNTIFEILQTESKNK